jgi:hypothetical protein
MLSEMGQGQKDRDTCPHFCVTAERTVAAESEARPEVGNGRTKATKPQMGDNKFGVAFL